MTLFDSKDAVMDNFHFFVVLQELSSLLSMEAMSFVTEDRKTVQESSFPNTYTFDLFGGVDVSSVRACFGVLFPRHAFSLVVRSPFLFSEPREYVLKFSILPPHPLPPVPSSTQKLLVEILMRPTLTTLKKKPKSK